MGTNTTQVFLGAVVLAALIAIVLLAGQPPQTRAGSATHAIGDIRAATDGNPATVWNSGASAPRWIDIDLGSAQRIEKVTLIVEQHPAGLTRHRVLASSDRASWRQIGQVHQHTKSGDTITVVPAVAGEFRYVRILTITSPSWVAWREITVERAGATCSACRIAVQGDVFLLGEDKFIPRGNNHILLAPVPHPNGGIVTTHALFHPAHYSREAQRAALRQMRRDGYNVVRVIVEPSTGDLPANVADFLKIADEEGIYVYLSFSQWLPPGFLTGTPPPQLESVNRFYLSQEAIDQRKLYLTSFIRSLKEEQAPLHRIFAYDVVNEVHLQEDKKPLSLANGTVKTATGTYQLPAQRQELMVAGLSSFIDQMRDAVRQEDPGALVTASFFPPLAVTGQDPRIVPPAGLVAQRTSADFIDLHAYPGAASLAQTMADAGMSNYSAKPLLMGEFGILQQGNAQAAAYHLRDWQQESCGHGFDGWLLWTWNHGPHSALQENGAINGVLAPIARPDPCR